MVKYRFIDFSAGWPVGFVPERGEWGFDIDRHGAQRYGLHDLGLRRYTDARASEGRW